MKTIIFLLAILITGINAAAQNVGISTNNPQAKLEINHTTTGNRPGLLLRDSSAFQAGSIKMQNISSGRNFQLDASQFGTGKGLGYLDINADSTPFIATFRSNGNVGIGQYDPIEKLDVNGNVNIATGTIKANGVAGQPGQMLMTNNSGQLQWANFNEYKNFIEFTATGTGTWTVPAGITKVLVECWGAGGGGNTYAGGGGGGYVQVVFQVTPAGVVSFMIGIGGAGTDLPTATNGGDTYVTIPSSGSNVIARGGGGAYRTLSGSTIIANGGLGGGYLNPFLPPLIDITGQKGQNGKGNKVEYYQGPSGNLIKTEFGGDGGDGANSVNTGGGGLSTIANLTTNTIIRYSGAANGTAPGGGGCGGYEGGSAGTFLGSNGGSGKIIIHY
jgi:hypothetical protein